MEVSDITDRGTDCREGNDCARGNLGRGYRM